MTMSPPHDRQIGQFIAAILAARKTPTAEVPDLIRRIGNAFSALRDGGIAETGDPAPVTETRKQQPRLEAAEPRRPRTHAAADSVDAPVPRRRGRPRKAPVEERVRRPEPVVAAAPAAPRLMRRAEVATQEAPPALDVRPPQQRAALRGVVRWFDQRTRSGTLRLPGFADDVAIDSALLERSAISRLYKGQEIEASVEGENGNARLVALALPGRNVEAGAALFKSGSSRRHAKPVVVEMKRDALRRAAARVEAEHVLGNGGRDRSR